MGPVTVRGPEATSPAEFIEAHLLERNRLSGPFFAREARGLAGASQQMADRFARGGRLLAVGRGHQASDAQHVEVEFVHPVLVGKRALPALDVSRSHEGALQTILRPADIVLGLGPPEGSSELDALLSWASARGALTLALPGTSGHYAIPPHGNDPFVHQELIEIAYHTLWETVHVFLEHQGRDHDAGAAGFLYPFLGRSAPAGDAVLDEVAVSIESKAAEDERLRVMVAAEAGPAITRAALAIGERLQRGGSLLLFGNGGSATDANDWALDCICSPKGHVPIPAVSLSDAPATLSALANDLGPDELFRRQLIAHARPEDVAIAISTSGGSRNVLAALEEARRRGLATIALLGHDGGEVVRRGMADHPIVVRCDYVPRVQEIQASIYHIVLDLLDAMRRGEVA